MLTVILNIIGVLCIVISLIFINKFSKEEKVLYEEIVLIHRDVKYYSDAIEKVLSSFDDLIETSLDNLEVLQRQDLNFMDLEEIEEKNNCNDEVMDQNKINLLDDFKEKDISTKEIKKKIIELKEQGLSNEDIAKRLNKGIREVDIIIKMWSNIYKKY